MKKTNAISMKGIGEFELSARGQQMTLLRVRDGWEMWTTNATTRAWGGPSVKCFPSLEAVEANYKTWKGVTELVNLSESGGGHEQVTPH